MKKIYTKKVIQKRDFNFVKIHITRKILVMIKNHLNYLKDNISECYFRVKYNGIFFFLIIFLIIYNDRKSKV